MIVGKILLHLRITGHSGANGARDRERKGEVGLESDEKRVATAAIFVKIATLSIGQALTFMLYAVA